MDHGEIYGVLSNWTYETIFSHVFCFQHTRKLIRRFVYNCISSIHFSPAILYSQCPNPFAAVKMFWMVSATQLARDQNYSHLLQGSVQGKFTEEEAQLVQVTIENYRLVSRSTVL